MSCCEKFAEASGAVLSDMGRGLLYPADMAPDAQIERYGGEWNVNGCCGGGCYVLTEIKFCPWCAAPLPTGDSDA